MRSITCATLASIAITGVADAQFERFSRGVPVEINEVRIGQPGAALDQYVEFTGGPGLSVNGFQLVVIGDAEGQFPPNQNGEVEILINLNGNFDANGVFVLASPSYTLGAANQTAADLVFEQGDNLTLILTSGYGGAAGSNIDTDNDGAIDAAAGLNVLDSLAIVATANPDGFGSDFIYSNTTVGPVDGFNPLHAWKCADSGAWRAGTDSLGSEDETAGLANPTCDGGGGGEGIVLNEYRLDQSGADNDEYIELAGDPGTTLDGLTFISIGDGSGGSGVVECAIDLTGQSIASDGYFVMAEATFTLGTPDFTVDGTDLNLENSDNVTYLLVRDFTAARNDDLDADDDGVIDSPAPWSEILDSLAVIETFGSGDLTYSDNQIGPDGSFVPAQGYRCSPDGLWTIGDFSSFDFDTPGAENVGCPTVQCGGADPRNCFEVRAEAGCSDGSCCDIVSTIDPTCGTEEWDASCVAIAQANCLSANAAPSLSLSEARLKQAGADDDEFVEIIGSPGTSLDGVSIVLVGSTGADNNGAVETAVNLSGYTIPSDGYFVVAEDTFTLGTADAVLDLNFNDTFNKTLVLVYNFVGTVNGDLDANDDCALDSGPWDDQLDSVALIGGNDTNCFYSSSIAGPDGDFTPGHIYICDAGSGTWGLGTFSVTDPNAADTPGAPNPADCDTTDCEGAIAQGLDAVGLNLIETYRPDCCDNWDASCDDFITRNYTFASAAPAQVDVVEVRIDQIGDDNDEYIELSTAPGQSMDGYTVVVLGDGSTGSGQVETRIPLIDVTADDNGLVLIADASTFTLGTPTYDASFDIENSDNITVLVVYGFSGDDLSPDLDAEDDGVLDSTPWVGSTSCIALIETDPAVEGDQVYCTTQIGPAETFVPGHVYFDCGLDSWVIGAFDPVGTDDTPGALNPGCSGGSEPCEADFNNDGIVNGADFGTLLAKWGPCPGCPEDLTGDGAVTGADIGSILAFWGDCP